MGAAMRQRKTQTETPPCRERHQIDGTQPPGPLLLTELKNWSIDEKDTVWWSRRAHEAMLKSWLFLVAHSLGFSFAIDGDIPLLLGAPRCDIRPSRPSQDASQVGTRRIPLLSFMQ
jgi:hypothetical protein